MQLTLKNYNIYNLDVLQGSLEGVKEGVRWNYIFELTGWCAIGGRNIERIIFEVDDNPISPINVELQDRPDLTANDINGKGFSIWLPFYLFTREVSVCKLKIIADDGSYYHFVEFELHVNLTKFRRKSQYKEVRIAPLFSMGRSGSSGLMKLMKDKEYVNIPGTAPYETRAVTYLCARTLLTIRTLSAQFCANFTDLMFFKNDMIFFDAPAIAKAQKEEVDAIIVNSALNGLNKGISDYLEMAEEDQYYVEKISSSGIECLCLLNLLYETKGIVLIRDLRDLICSTRQYKLRFPNSDFTDFSTEQEYKELRAIAQQMICVLKTFPQWHVVRYEEMVKDPGKVSKQLDRYFGKKAKKKQKRQTAGGAAEFEKEHVTSETIDLSVGRWKNDAYFMERIEWFNMYLKDVNEHFGYQ
ncbi:hypothetical protein V8J88_14345 [Massilia sp. W12]|uniref:hypothetical protein n=1 Tax=Massilia sp. W12 TaxID=3126507 RepID=UPI0030CCE1AD